MLIKYTGQATVRRIDTLEWNQANGYVVDITDADLALHLLTHGNETFAIAPVDPLAGLVGQDKAGALALAGVIDLASLAALTGERVKQAAGEAGVSPPVIREWIKQAKNILILTGEANASPQED